MDGWMDVCGGGEGRTGRGGKAWQTVLLVLVCVWWGEGGGGKIWQKNVAGACVCGGGGGREVKLRFGKKCCWCLCVVVVGERWK